MGESEFMGNLISAIAIIAGLTITIGTPLLKLNKTMTQFGLEIKFLSEKIQGNTDQIEEFKDKAKESHKRLHNRIDECDDKISDIDKRVTKLEG